MKCLIDANQINIPYFKLSYYLKTIGRAIYRLGTQILVVIPDVNGGSISC